MTKERPILFSAPMVRAILEGRKTQTRRIVKPQPFCPGAVIEPAIVNGESVWRVFGKYLNDTDRDNDLRRCHHGKCGDVLWVREAWKPHCDCNAEGAIDDQHPLGTCVKYKADGVMLKPTTWTVDQGYWCEAREMTNRWHTPIHMPRWASRIDLRITGVRVERLNDISGEDCVSEGITPKTSRMMSVYRRITNIEQYRSLWESIHGKDSWQLNPWVWVIEFERVNPL